MRDVSTCSPSHPASRRTGLALVVLATALALPTSAHAGKLSWLDEVVQEVVRETRAGGKAVARGSDGASTTLRASGRLFAHEADDGLEMLVKRSDDLARAGRRVEGTSEALLQKRFARLLPKDAEAARTFSRLAPAEKRLVVEMTEAAEVLARRYPGQAEGMIRAMGTEGLTAVRVFGDDVAEVIVKEGPASVGVLRKTGRGGWGFFTREVLPHKKKLVAAGVLAAFLAESRQVRRLRRPRHRVRRSGVLQSRRPARRGRGRGRGEGPGGVGGQGPGPLRAQLRGGPLSRDRCRGPGRGVRLDGLARPTRPMGAPAGDLAVGDASSAGGGRRRPYDPWEVGSS